MKKIDKFIDETYFLSNFYQCPVKYHDITYPHAESAFQAQKTHNQTVRKIFKKLTPTEAKKLGKHIYLRKDWNEVKDQKMYEICYAKFKQNPQLKKKLLETGDSVLIEGNKWHDTYWGMCNNKGRNKLGKILMKIRDDFKKEYN